MIKTLYTKKKNIDAARRDITEDKESAQKAYEQERSQREKAWFDGRVSEIPKLTWNVSTRPFARHPTQS